MLLCSNVAKFVRREIGEFVRYSHDKKAEFRLPLKLSLQNKSRQNLPELAPNIWLT